MRDGSVIGGNYRLCKRVGSGSYGAVWRAEEVRGGQAVVAIKVFNADPDEAEMAMLADLAHPRILRYRTTLVHDGTLCLVTDFADGGDALSLIQAFPGGVPPEMVARLIHEVTQGLAYLHERNIAHRDIKPSNILFVGGAACLGDVGLAQALSRTQTHHSGRMTVAYAAPELFSNQLSLKSDIYALGVTAFELLSGKLPFEGHDAAVMLGHLQQQPVLPDGVSEAWQNFLSTCLSKSPDARPSADDLLLHPALGRPTINSRSLTAVQTEDQSRLSAVEQLMLAQQHYQNGNFEVAVRWARAAAEQGSPEAQRLMGNMCQNGLGVGVDHVQAIEWYEKAARQGLAPAQRSLGLMLKAGLGGAPEHQRAAEWFRQAALQGDAAAQFNLAMMLLQGQGQPFHPQQAAEWCARAASQGNVAAQYHLGLLYESGTGVESDTTSARRWFETAAHKGHRGALEKVVTSSGRDYLFDIEWELDGEAKETAFRTTFAWQEKGAEAGIVDAQVTLAEMYELGKGIAQAMDKATLWYGKAAEQGDRWAALRLGKICLARHETTDEAIAWFERAAAAGANEALETTEIVRRSRMKEPQAQFQLAKLIADGGNTEKAHYLYLEAAKLGHAEAQFTAATMYQEGKGLGLLSFKDRIEKAVFWYEQAARQGHINAQKKLVSIYQYGEGWEVPRDEEKAFYWTEKLANQGDSRSQMNLAEMYDEGVGTNVDVGRALYWYQVASRTERLNAPFRVGRFYEEGRGVPQDSLEAIRWYTIAADAKNGSACIQIGVIYADGIGIAQDGEQAVAWFSRAAEMGYPEACEALAAMYREGHGVLQDLAMAAYWGDRGDALRHAPPLYM